MRGHCERIIFVHGLVSILVLKYADADGATHGFARLAARAAIKAFWKGATQQRGDAKPTTVDILPPGRTAAREIGTVTLKTKAQPPQEVVGKYVVAWRKIGRDWKLAADIWNTNK